MEEGGKVTRRDASSHRLEKRRSQSSKMLVILIILGVIGSVVLYHYLIEEVQEKLDEFRAQLAQIHREGQTSQDLQHAFERIKK